MSTRASHCNVICILEASASGVHWLEVNKIAPAQFDHRTSRKCGCPSPKIGRRKQIARGHPGDFCSLTCHGCWALPLPPSLTPPHEISFLCSVHRAGDAPKPKSDSCPALAPKVSGEALIGRCGSGVHPLSNQLRLEGFSP